MVLKLNNLYTYDLTHVRAHCHVVLDIHDLIILVFARMPSFSQQVGHLEGSSLSWRETGYRDTQPVLLPAVLEVLEANFRT